MYNSLCVSGGMTLAFTQEYFLSQDEAEKLRKEAEDRQEERVSNVKQQQQNLIKELKQEKVKCH